MRPLAPGGAHHHHLATPGAQWSLCRRTHTEPGWAPTGQPVRCCPGAAYHARDTRPTIAPDPHLPLAAPVPRPAGRPASAPSLHKITRNLPRRPASGADYPRPDQTPGRFNPPLQGWACDSNPGSVDITTICLEGGNGASRLCLEASGGPAGNPAWNRSILGGAPIRLQARSWADIQYVPDSG